MPLTYAEAAASRLATAVPMGRAKSASLVAPRNAPFRSGHGFDHDHRCESSQRFSQPASACAPVELPRRRITQSHTRDARRTACGACHSRWATGGAECADEHALEL